MQTKCQLLLLINFYSSFCLMADVEILIPVSFSIPVNLLAHTFEMFILERYALAISAGGFVMII